ncbi:hypothetical protein PHET_03699 [Paragonimus heterotremus]|uniref:Uncharacterized protein n=1 Tax=Paragonimus heterotremus TaxID=100268 RepID=A0A8J4WIU6_9TREM|nr:hypothetical protein PHET_03699 [Paragonimus heterotremus]
MKMCKKENTYLRFSPAKVTSQILVKQQLNAHYQKVQNAKATIDNKIPYSYLSNPTTRGYRKNHKPYTRTSSSSEYHSVCEANVSAVNNYSDDQTVDQIVRTFLTDNATSSRRVSPVANVLKTPSRPNIPTAMQDKTLKISENGHSSSVASSRRFRADFVTGDVLQMHRNKFTPEKPFSPRLIRSNATSKLRSLRCYNPPIRMTKSNSSKISQDEDQNLRPATTADIIADSHSEEKNQRKIMKQDVHRPVSSQTCRISLGRRLAEDDTNSKHRQTPGVCFVPSPRPTALSTEIDRQTPLPANVSAQTSLELTKVGEWLKSLNPKDDEIPVAMVS